MVAREAKVLDGAERSCALLVSRSDGGRLTRPAVLGIYGIYDLPLDINACVSFVVLSLAVQRAAAHESVTASVEFTTVKSDGRVESRLLAPGGLVEHIIMLCSTAFYYVTMLSPFYITSYHAIPGCTVIP